jgi:hypothetical protein
MREYPYPNTIAPETFSFLERSLREIKNKKGISENHRRKVSGYGGVESVKRKTERSTKKRCFLLMKF